MEVKNKKRKAGKAAENGKIHKNDKPAVKKMKINKEKKSLDDSPSSNGLTSNKLNKKKNSKIVEKNIKNKKKFNSENSETIKKGVVDVTVEGKTNKTITDSNELKNELKKNGTDQKLKKKIIQKVRNVERRKELRKEFGQYKPENIDLTEEELTRKIESINSKGLLSKTARRKLSVFKKKLQILQGTYVPNPPPPPSSLTKSEKRKLRKKRLRQAVAIAKQEGGVGADNENVNIQVKAKQAAGAVKGLKIQRQENVMNKDKQTKKQEVTKNKTMKIKTKNIKKEVEEDDEDEESDEEDDETIKIKTKNIKKEVEDDDENEESNEDNEDDDENEESDEDNEDDDEKIKIKPKNIKNEVEEDDESEESDEDNEESDEDENDNEVMQSKKPNKVVKVENKGKLNKAASVSSSNEGSEKKKRYVLFVGNLPFTATSEEIKNHFLTKVSQITDVRIPLSKTTQQPRGMAYVEFNNSIDYEKGLSLHQTQMKNRKINVLYSTHGSKKVGNRSDIIAKNKKLHALRKQGKLAGSVKETQKRSVRRNKQKKKSD